MDFQEISNNMIADFDRAVAINSKIEKLQRKIDAEKAGYTEASDLGAAAGLESGDIILKILSELYPEGKIPREEAEEILMPLLQHQHEYIVDAAAKVQETMNKKAKIGLKAIRPEFNLDRARDLIYYISDRSFEDGFSW